MDCTVLYCTVLYCTALYCIVVYCMYCTSVQYTHRIINDRMENDGVYIGFISKKHCREAKDCLSRREFVQHTADCEGTGLLWKFLFVISQNFREIINFMFHEIFIKFHEILRNSNKFCQNFVFREICTMLFRSNPM